jgi:hypothetical protein
MAAIAVVLVAGCSSGTTGSALPTGGATTPAGVAHTSGSSASGSASYGAPKVSTPMDTTKYQQNPCAALTSAQVASFGLAGPGTQATGTTVDNTASGPTCSWFVGRTMTIAGIAFFTDYHDSRGKGLGFDYSSGTPHRLADIQGQPAVLHERGQGTCQIDVGATDDVFYAAKVMGWTSSDPCTEAEQVATAATATMKSGG